MDAFTSFLESQSSSRNSWTYDYLKNFRQISPIVQNHLKQREHSELVLPDLGENEMKESGFIIPQYIPSHSWLKRGFDAAPNRYGIKPGRHWDGVDRSNGFEKQMFKRTNEKQATEKEAYLWSVSDM